MRLVTFKTADLSAYFSDKEMLFKQGRPCALIVKLKYKGTYYDFAVPLRSNINKSAPRNEYFPLPPRSTTRPPNRHGVHYAKMFPVDKSKAIKYRVEGNAYATMIKNILDKNEKIIVKECQDYLIEVENGNKPSFGTDIDLLIKYV